MGYAIADRMSADLAVLELTRRVPAGDVVPFELPPELRGGPEVVVAARVPDLDVAPFHEQLPAWGAR